MKEVFVLTVVRDNVLDSCEVFESLEVALNSARDFCEYTNIRMSDNFTYDNKMRGWFISDSYGYFVSVQKRVAHEKEYLVDSSYGLFLNSLDYRKIIYPTSPLPLPFYLRKDFITNKDLLAKDDGSDLKHTTEYVNDVVKTVPVPNTKVNTVSNSKPVILPVYAPGDTPKSLDLPGGFSWNDNKALTMLQVYDFPNNVKLISDLTEEQRWALVLARTKHREKQVIVLPKMGCYSQFYMLKELKARTPTGLLIRDQELKEIQDQYNEAIDLQEEESSSSSSEFEDLD